MPKAASPTWIRVEGHDQRGPNICLAGSDRRSRVWCAFAIQVWSEEPWGKDCPVVSDRRFFGFVPMGKQREEKPGMLGTPLVASATPYGGLPCSGGFGSGVGCVPMV